MNELPRTQLCELVARHGPSLGADPQRCEALLRDLCTGYKREVHTLASAARERVPAELLASKSGATPVLVLARLTKRLQDNLGLSEEAARWAVESWAVALGVVSPQQLAGLPIPVPPAPPPVVPAARPASPNPGQPLYIPPAPELYAVKACPFCGEPILATALKCKHCGEILDPGLRAAEEAQRAAERAARAGTAVNTQVHVHGHQGRPRPDPPFPHLMHLVLTVFFCGGWLPIYVLHYLFSSRSFGNFLLRLVSTGICLSVLAVGGYFAYGLILSRGIPFVTNYADRLMTAEKLKKIALALRTYQDRHGRLPPPVLQDPEGQPYSWRVAILPYLGEQSLYDSYNRKEPWDSQTNRRVLARMPAVYAAPVLTTPGPNMTFYQVFVGPGAAFEEGQGMLVPDDFPDGASQTILVVEAGEAVSWTKPVDLPYSPFQPLPRLGGPTGEIKVSFADGSTRSLPKETQESVLRALITRNGKEVIAPGDLP